MSNNINHIEYMTCYMPDMSNISKIGRTLSSSVDGIYVQKELPNRSSDWLVLAGIRQPQSASVLVSLGQPQSALVSLSRS